LGGGLDQYIPRHLTAAVYLWHLIGLPCLLLTWIVLGLLRTPGRLAKWLGERSAVPPESPLMATEAGQVSPSRRQFLGATFAAAPPLLTTGAVAYSGTTLDHFRIRRVDVPIANLPPGIDGATIAHVTDIHVGRFTTERQLRTIVEATNNLRADVILMTGDLINNSLADLPGSIDALRRMDSPGGVYLCEGNHDLFDDPTGFRQGVKSAGVPLLVNESRTFRVGGYPVQILGLPWGLGQANRTAGGGDNALALSVPHLLTQRDPNAFAILLAHHPHAFDFAASANIPLTLAGHTHGGQLMLTPGVGFGPMFYRYWSGLYQKGSSSLVVSNGVGNWFPLRVNAPAEILHLTLRKA
jgi:predicted MPP superfamily phosphohydrolase